MNNKSAAQKHADAFSYNNRHAYTVTHVKTTTSQLFTATLFIQWGRLENKLNLVH